MSRGRGGVGAVITAKEKYRVDVERKVQKPHPKYSDVIIVFARKYTCPGCQETKTCFFYASMSVIVNGGATFLIHPVFKDSQSDFQ